MMKDVFNEIGVILAFTVTVLDFSAVFAADKIRLSDIMVLTLYDGRMSNSRRSSAIPQLKCIGGSAGCQSFKPQVVQCYNRGSDGVDVQWECKTDMDNAYRFGRVEVSCEGYEYPDDPYVLRGSCALEYTIDLTKEGYQQKKHRKNEYHNYYGDSDYGDSNSYEGHHSYQKSSGMGDIILLAIIGLIIYAIYKTCLSNTQTGNTGDETGTDDYNTSGYGGSGYGTGSGSSPPPPGFRPSYMPGGGCSSSRSHSTDTTGTAPGGGGFWTGAATGGILGYLLGNSGQRNTGYGYGYARPRTGWGWGSSGFGSGSFGSGSFGGSSGSSSYSSGTRTASGFGGTRRR